MLISDDSTSVVDSSPSYSRLNRLFRKLCKYNIKKFILKSSHFDEITILQNPMKLYHFRNKRFNL